MRPNAEAWTVVLVGQWNPAVFNPEWVARNLYENKPVIAEFAAGPGLLAVAGWRIIAGNLVVIPSRDRLVLGTKEATDEGLRGVESAARRVLDLLPHTPLQAAGVNFAFTEDAPQSETIALVKAPDVRQFSDKGYDVVRQELHRAVRIDKDTVSTVVAFEATGPLSISVNIHRDLGGVQPEARASACRDALDNRVVQAKAQALAILSSVYGLQLAEDAQ